MFVLPIANSTATPHLFSLHLHSQSTIVFPIHFARIAKIFRPVDLKGRDFILPRGLNAPLKLP
jgi:hypothetical protein